MSATNFSHNYNVTQIIILTSVAKNRAFAGSYLMATVSVLNTVFNNITMSSLFTITTFKDQIKKNIYFADIIALIECV